MWEETWDHIKGVVSVVREPVVFLNKELKLIAANESFYSAFLLGKIDTEFKCVYELGKKEWNTGHLRKLLEKILPNAGECKNYKLEQEFPVIGKKSLVLNAKYINFKVDTTNELQSPIIMLSIEDQTGLLQGVEKYVDNIKKLEEHIERLERKIKNL